MKERTVHRSGASECSGFTLVEMAIASIVLAVMSAVIAQSLRQMSVAQTTMHEQSKIASLAERIVEVIESDVKHSLRLFGERSDHRAYLERMDLAPVLGAVGGILSESRMPVATTSGAFAPDGDTVETGNMLFLAIRDGHEVVEATVDSVTFRRRIDIRRFGLWCLHRGVETGVDLAQWRSERIAHFADLDSIEPVARRDAVVAELVARGIRFAWDSGMPAADAFKELDASGAIRDYPEGVDGLLPGDEPECESAVLGRRFVGVAQNGLANPSVPEFAKATQGFPHGFELKHDGDGSGDLLMIRLVVSNRTTEGRVLVVSEVVRQVDFRSE